MDAHLIKLLTKLEEYNDWISSRELSLILGFSPSSIKNYVSAINRSMTDLIISSTNGYRLNPTINLADLDHLFNSADSGLNNAENRRKILLSKLLDTKKRSNIYDLCNDLYVSVTTLKKDIISLNDAIRKYDIKIVQFGDEVELIGLEKNKRSLFIDNVYSDSQSNIITVDMIDNLFPKINVFELMNLISDHLINHEVHFDDFTLMDIILHVALFAQRIKLDYVITKRQELFDIDDKVFNITTSLAAEIEKFLSLTINEYELYELYLLIISKLSFYKNKQITSQNIHTYIDKDVMKLIDEIINFLSDFYNVDLYDEVYYTPFVLHINQLLIRSKAEHFLKNPLLDSLKNEHPFVYQLSVSIVEIISKHTKTQIADDEIGYLTIHLGGSFARQSKKYKKIITALVVPNNKTLTKKLQSRIDSDMEDYLYIEQIFTNQYENEELDRFDLIITTIPINTTIPSVVISPLYEMNDQMKVFKKIEQINLNSQYQNFIKHIKFITDYRFFMKNTVLTNKNEVIDVVSDILFNAGYVNSEFRDNVYHRESLSSTAFNNIAIPHTFNMDAIESKMYIILSEKPIQWDKNNVHIIFFFAINEKDKKMFYTIYEIISLIFSNQKNVLKSLKTSKYDEFINLLTEVDDFMDI